MSRHNVAPQLPHVLDGFYDPDNGDLRVQLGRPVIREGSTNCAFGMDASGSMAAHYKHHGWSGNKPSEVEEFIHKTGRTVAGLDSDSGVQVYAWAAGDGHQVVDLGNFPADKLETLQIKTTDDGGSLRLGSGTYLRPALQKMWQEISVDPKADMAYLVLATDGAINDFDDVVRWTTEKAKAIAAKTISPFKVVLAGFDNSDKNQLEALDNLDTGTDIDIFDAQAVDDLEAAAEHLTDEALSSEFKVAEGGYLEANGTKYPFEGGVPQRIDMRVGTGLSSVTLVIVEGGAEVDRLNIVLPVGAGVR